MKHCLALRHVTFEDLGAYAAPIVAAGYAIRVCDTPVAAIGVDDALAADLLVVLGGPVGVGDAAHLPWLAAERDLVAARLAAERPTLGVCLGAQLMAAALGAAVVRAPAVEIGWSPLTLPAAGQTSPLAALAGLPVLHWHGDRFDLPAGAIRLAATDLCPTQAFAVGAHALALQFHAEVEPARFEDWLAGNAAELTALAIAPARLRAAAGIHAAAAASAGAAMVRDWLAALA